MEDKDSMKTELMILCTAVYNPNFNDSRTDSSDYFDYLDYLQKFIESDGRVVCLAQIEPSPDGQLRHPENIRQAKH